MFLECENWTRRSWSPLETPLSSPYFLPQTWSSLTVFSNSLELRNDFRDRVVNLLLYDNIGHCITTVKIRQLLFQVFHHTIEISLSFLPFCSFFPYLRPFPFLLFLFIFPSGLPRREMSKLFFFPRELWREEHGYLCHTLKLPRNKTDEALQILCLRNTGSHWPAKGWCEHQAFSGNYT